MYNDLTVFVFAFSNCNTNYSSGTVRAQQKQTTVPIKETMSSKAALNRRKAPCKSGIATKNNKRGQRKSIIAGERPKHKGYRQLQESEQAAIEKVEALQKQLKMMQNSRRRELAELKKLKNELMTQVEKNSALQEQQQNSERTCSLLSSALEVLCIMNLVPS